MSSNTVEKFFSVIFEICIFSNTDEFFFKYCWKNIFFSHIWNLFFNCSQKIFQTLLKNCYSNMSEFFFQLRLKNLLEKNQNFKKLLPLCASPKVCFDDETEICCGSFPFISAAALRPCRNQLCFLVFNQFLPSQLYYHHQLKHHQKQLSQVSWRKKLKTSQLLHLSLDDLRKATHQQALGSGGLSWSSPQHEDLSLLVANMNGQLRKGKKYMLIII